MECSHDGVNVFGTVIASVVSGVVVLVAGQIIRTLVLNPPDEPADDGGD